MPSTRFRGKSHFLNSIFANFQLEGTASKYTPFGRSPPCGLATRGQQSNNYGIQNMTTLPFLRMLLIDILSSTHIPYAVRLQEGTSCVQRSIVVIISTFHVRIRINQDIHRLRLTFQGGDMQSRQTIIVYPLRASAGREQLPQRAGVTSLHREIQRRFSIPLPPGARCPRLKQYLQQEQNSTQEIM